MLQYVVFSLLEAVEYHAHAGAYVVGMPQPTAVAGLAHACARSLCGGAPATLNHCLYAVGSATLGGQSRHMVNEHGASKEKRASPGPLVDRARATIHLSLVVVLEHRQPILEAAAEAAIERQRLMGASLFVRRPPVVVPGLADALKLLPTTHFVVCDAADEVAALTAEGMDTAGAIASLVSRPPPGEYKPHYAPVLSGYRLLEPPVARPGRRAGAAAHAHAEPVVGVALLRSRASALHALRQDPDAPLLWRHTRQGDLCVLRGVPAPADAIDVDEL